MREQLARFKEKISRSFGGSENIPEGEEYIEVETGAQAKRTKIVVRPFVIEEFDDIKPTLDALREGYTIALVNIRPIKDKDIIELKRAVNKLKKTCDAIEGDIAGFGEDWIVVTPSFAQIHRSKQTEEVKE
ncbi:MAG: cell division protein SepF [Candidatus Woesearchaeota archaeon]|nr:MAG: cell division protein SepF [Candidatus Woesearchaeota archaeon]